jgi:hypothetical protein
MLERVVVKFLTKLLVVENRASTPFAIIVCQKRIRQEIVLQQGNPPLPFLARMTLGDGGESARCFTFARVRPDRKVAAADWEENADRGNR